MPICKVIIRVGILYLLTFHVMTCLIQSQYRYCVKNRNNEIISTDAAFLHVVKPEVFSVHPSFLPAFTERVPLTAFEG